MGLYDCLFCFGRTVLALRARGKKAFGIYQKGDKVPSIVCKRFGSASGTARWNVAVGRSDGYILEVLG